MAKKSSNCYVSPDIAVILCLSFLPVIIGILAHVPLALMAGFESGEVEGIFYAALGGEVIGIVLLFLARLPLYRQGLCWTMGPGQLDASHRKLYWAGYGLILVGLVLMTLIWLRMEMGVIVVGSILAITGFVIATVGNVMFLTAAYRRNLWWFFGCLFLPPVWLGFWILHPKETMKPMGLLLLGIMLAGIGYACHCAGFSAF